GDRFRRILGSNRELLLQENIAGIEAGVDAHRRPASYRFSVGNRPLDRRGSAVLGQQRTVQINIAQRREVEHPLRYDAAVSDYDDGVRPQRGELSAKFFVVLDAIRLGDGKSEGE